MSTVFLGDALYLRRPSQSDLSAILAVHGDPATNRYNPAGVMQDEAAAQQRLTEWDTDWQQHGFGYWAVSETEQGAAMGFSGVRVSELHGRQVLNLYYRYGPAAWGKGIASRVATHVVQWARTHHPTMPVVAITLPENVPSQKTALKAGLLARPDLMTQDAYGKVMVLALGWDDPLP